MAGFLDLMNKKYGGDLSKYIIIDETKIPLSGLENINLKYGDTVVVELEITISEPSISGFRGLVHTAKTTGYKKLSSMETIDK